jgi:LmbE family N-acetylglucosaminyl deacetylase
MINLNKQRLLIIAPHPDDEVIGCGGFIQRIKKESGKVYVLFLTVGLTDDFSKKGRSSSEQRKKEIEKVSSFLRYDDYDIAFEGNDYHLKLDTFGQKELMDVIERRSLVAIEKIRPTIVAFPSFHSYNQDHRVVAYAAHAALRPAEKDVKHFVPIVLQYEEVVDSWNSGKQIIPNFFVSLNEKEIENKSKALRLYRSQLRGFPNPRSTEALKTLAKLRGTQSGNSFSEGFFIHRLTYDL